MSVHGRQAGHPLIEIAQVKQRMASLRIYTDGRCDCCSGAINFACRLSRHVYEETGRPGILMVRGRMLRTFAEDVSSVNGYSRYQPEGGISVDDGSRPCECLPPGWHTIAGVALGVPEATLRFGHADGELLDGVSGAIACARRIAIRSNPATGMMQIPPPHNSDEADHTPGVVKSKHRGQRGYLPIPNSDRVTGMPLSIRGLWRRHSAHHCLRRHAIADLGTPATRLGSGPANLEGLVPGTPQLTPRVSTSYIPPVFARFA